MAPGDMKVAFLTPGRGADTAALVEYDPGRLSDVLGKSVHDPMDLYAVQRDASLHAAGRALGMQIVAPNSEETR